MNPPLSAMALPSSIEIKRGWVYAAVLMWLWVITTGLLLAFIASKAVCSDACATSIIIPNSFIPDTTSWPKGVKPLLPITPVVMSPRVLLW